MPGETSSHIHGVLFDFGGVLAEEGFREGLMTIARANGLDPVEFFRTAAHEAYYGGYVVGRAAEEDFWEALRRTTGIIGSDEEFRREILDRFVLRPWVLDLVRRVRRLVRIVAILSDQTNWLDELDARYHFFKEFYYVFNSYHLGASKMDAKTFSDVASEIGCDPWEILFIDDNEGHIERARSRGLHAVLFVDQADLLDNLTLLGLNP